MSRMITAISFNFPSKAYLANAYLNANGMETLLKDEMTVQTKNFNSMAVGGIKIQVKEEDYEQAYSLLIEGGYIVEEAKRVNSPLVNRFDRLTATIPVIQKLNLETKLLAAVGIVIIVILIPILIMLGLEN